MSGPSILRWIDLATRGGPRHVADLDAPVDCSFRIALVEELRSPIPLEEMREPSTVKFRTSIAVQVHTSLAPSGAALAVGTFFAFT